MAFPAAFFAALVALVVTVGSASAANGVVNFFGSNGPEGSEGGQFSANAGGPGGIAVNQAGTGGATAGDVYVVDRGNQRIQQFEADGTWVRAFGKDVGGSGVDVCEVAESCVQASASAEAGGMSSPLGVAIDQANGNLYVTDQSNRRVDVYSAEGDFEGAFGWEVDATTPEASLQFCTTATGCQQGSSGANAGQLGAQVGYPAVAPAGSPNAGDLYVADKSNRRVDEFEPTLTGEEVTGIAFAKAWGWGVDTGAAEFEQCTTASACQSPNTSSPTSNPGQFSFNQPSALAVDSNGNVYAAESGGNSRAQKFDSTGAPAVFSATQLTGSPGPSDIAVDPTTDHVFAIKQAEGSSEKRVLEFNSSGVFVKTHASGTEIISIGGLASVSGTENFYVTSHINAGSSPTGQNINGVFFLGTKVNPTASTEAPSPLESHSATLLGQVNPKGFTTTYQFEFSRDGGSSWEKLPASPVDLGNGEADIPVSQEVSGLVGGSQYRYKIVATKPFGAGTTVTSQRTFVAPASTPQIPAAFASAVTTRTAVLNAEINPNNQETTYHFEYGTGDCSANICTSVPVPDSGIGSGAAAVSVAKEVGGLAAGTTYHYRVVATNPTGTTEGADHTFNTYAVSAPRTDCPNQVYRTGPGATLPDCRAYEMVSPVDKNGGDISYLYIISVYSPAPMHNQSALSGDKIAYSSSSTPFAGAVGSPFVSQYIASRGADGWSTESISPPERGGLDGGSGVFDREYYAFSPELSFGWLQPESVEQPLAPGALAGHRNIYRRDSSTGAFETISIGNEGRLALLQGTSRDGSHAYFSTPSQLTPEAPVLNGELFERSIYEWVNGSLRLVSILPNGEPFAGTTTIGAVESSNGNGVYSRRGRGQNVERAISADGSHVVWTAMPKPSEVEPGHAGGKIYDRIDGERTVAVSESVTSVSSVFRTASVDGSKIIFSAGSPDETSPSYTPGPLYEFDVETETSTLIAPEVNGVVGASEDVSYLYFVSTAVLDEGGTAGGRNLYLYHDGEATFIATLSVEDTNLDQPVNLSAIHESPTKHDARVSANGHAVVFLSQRSLTGYDNTSISSSVPVSEVYRYDADSGRLDCVSCNPSGARPAASSKIPMNSYGITFDVEVAAWIPPWQGDIYGSRAVSDSGDRVFFNSYDALLPQDTNGVQDVYEWEAPGSGDCNKESAGFSAENGGCVSLISSGESGAYSEFTDASASGNDVFFRTRSSLVPQDPGLYDLYDARVGGGLPTPKQVSSCSGDTCQSPGEAPREPTPASAVFRGAGNLASHSAVNCGARARRAAKLSRRSRVLRRRAKRLRVARKARVLRKRSARYARQAKGLSKSARRCRRANRRAKR